MKSITNIQWKKIGFLLLIAIWFPCAGYSQVKNVKHVVLIGVDGLGAYCFPEADIPNMKKMMRNGAYTLHARCVLPSSSADNWASMIMGAGPSLHGYTEWNSQTPELPSRVKGQYGLFPSIFTIMREQMPESTLGVVYSWGGVGYLFPKKAVDIDQHVNTGDSATIAAAIKVIREQKPTLLMIHLSAPDGAGHSIGHGTPGYYASVHETDKRIGKILDALEITGIMKQSIVMVSSDHGGINKGHGGKTLQEVEIPWIIYGAGIRKNVELDQSIMTYDTAATLAYIFGLEMPGVWIGRPIKSAFGTEL